MAEKEYIERGANVCAAIADGLRHVVVPEGLPMKIGIVLEYAETTVRHEFVPKKINETRKGE